MTPQEWNEALHPFRSNAEVDTVVEAEVRALLTRLGAHRMPTTELTERLYRSDYRIGEAGTKAARRLIVAVLRLAKSELRSCSLADCAAHDGRQWKGYGKVQTGWTWHTPDPAYEWPPEPEPVNVFTPLTHCPHCGGKL